MAVRLWVGPEGTVWAHGEDLRSALGLSHVGLAFDAHSVLVHEGELWLAERAALATALAAGVAEGAALQWLGGQLVAALEQLSPPCQAVAVGALTSRFQAAAQAVEAAA